MIREKGKESSLDWDLIRAHLRSAFISVAEIRRKQGLSLS